MPIVRPVYGYNPPGNPASSWLAAEIQARRAMLSRDDELAGIGKVIKMEPLHVTGRLGPQREGELETKGGGWGELAAIGVGIWALLGG